MSDHRQRCRCCTKPRKLHRRGLCWSCYYKPGVRDQYPSTSRFANRGVPDGDGARPLPPAPTAALPTTEAKIRAMQERAAARASLWHPRDAQVDLR